MTLVLPPLASIGSAYQEGIVDTGREPQFVFLAAFLLTFGFIRASTHMIRAQVSWWPGNVSVGGTHIHHLVWGILLLLSVGWAGIVLQPESPWLEISAALFGIGTGLTLDEFALWLNLKDVYWEKEGRRSIDAVIIAAGLAGIVLVGFRGWLDAATSVEEEVFAIAGSAGTVGIALALVNVSKDKFGMALLGLIVPIVNLVGAARLGKPHSLWAKLFYRRGRLERSRERFRGSRGEPIWRRGDDLVRWLRLRLGRLSPSARRARRS